MTDATSRTERRCGDVHAMVDADGVGTLRLSRPDRLNAVTGDTFVELEQAARWLGASPECRAIVLTGEGRAFCAGMDLDHGPAFTGASEADKDPIERAHDGVRAGVAAVLALREIPQPVIAAVRGHAVGAGFALAAASDVRVCASDARFAAVFVRLGVSAGDLGLSWFLPRLVGQARAAELCLTGGTLDADQAFDAELVTHVVDDPEHRAYELAAQIACHPSYGVSATKQLLNASPSAGLREHLESELRAQVIGLSTSAHARAVAAVRH